MDYKQLKSGVKEIAEISASVPEQFRDKCFEILLSSLLETQRPSTDGNDSRKSLDKTNGSKNNDNIPTPNSIPMTTQLRLLMKKTGVTAEELEKVVMFDKDDVHFIKEPHDVAISTGQTEWALLLALKNAILSDSMSTDRKMHAQSAKQKAFTTKPSNFATNFKSPKNAKLFKSALVPQGPAEPLSSDGQDALGRLIKRLSGESQ